MARELNIRFKELILAYIAPHKRSANRIAWLTGLISLQTVFDRFAAWRSYYRYKIMLSGQRLVLEGHLRKVFGKDIIVKSFADGYVGIGLNIEPAHWKKFGKNNEGCFVSFPLTGERLAEFEDYDFLVIVSAKYNINLVRAEVEKYKLADKKYNIIIA